MAGNIKGITIEFRGDTTKLQKALRDVRSESKTLDKELKYVNNSLKFNPTSVTMWSQKQKVLTQEVTNTKARLTELKNIKAQLEGQGLDRNSAEFREVEREIQKAKSQLSTFRKELATVGSARLTALSQAFKSIGKKMTEIGTTLTTRITLPLSILGGKAVKSFAEVDKTMQLTNKTMGNSKEQAELLDEAMKTAAANSTYGMTDAATATLNFARAGLTAEQSAEALAPAMNLAAGEGGNLDTVSSGLVATINGFHDSFEDAGKYADVFANACNNSALDVDSLSGAMSVAAPIFSSAGYKVEDAALYMGIMANNGIEANKAANSLKTGLARLISPAKDGATMMKKLGISVTNADGTMKDSTTIQKELHDAFSKLSESEQIAAASAIFGKNQMAPWLALINTAPKDVDSLSTALGKTGTTTEMATSMMGGFGGSLEKLKSGLDVAATSLGEALAPAISKVADWIQKAVDWFNGLDKKTQSLIATVGIVVAAIGPVIAILGGLFTAVGTVLGAVSKAIGIIKLVISVLGGPLALAIAAAVAVGVLLYKNWDKIKETATKVVAHIQAKWILLKRQLSTTINDIKKKVVDTWDNIKTTVTTTVTNLITAVKTAWTNLKTNVSTLVDGIKTKVSTVWDAIKTKVTTVVDALKTAVATKFETIKGKIVAPIEKARDLIKAAIDKIKSIINTVKLSIPHFKLPHFKINGGKAPWGIGGLGTPPSFNIEWYKRGGIFNSPSLIGVGEAGAEAVLPIEKLKDWMQEMNGGVTINVYAREGMDIDTLVNEIERKMTQNYKRRALAW